MKMNITMKKFLFLTLAVMMVPALSMAQRSDENVRVKVRKNQNGNVIQMEEAVPAGEAEDLEGILKKYGVEEELGELKPGEEVEITITRKKGDDVSQEMKIDLDREREVVPVDKTASRAFLGVHYEMHHTPPRGSYINQVVKDTPAEKAGLKRGDIITAVNGEGINTLDDLSRIVSSKKPGDKIKITYNRNGDLQTVKATLGERKDDFFFGQRGNHFEYNIDFDDFNGGHIWIDDDNNVFHRKKKDKAEKGFLGVTFMRTEKKMNINGEEFTETEGSGLKISSVLDNTTAKEIGLQDGDEITGINGRKVSEFKDLTDAMNRIKVGDEITVDYLRNGNSGRASGTMRGRKDHDVPHGQIKMFKFDGDNGEEFEFNFNEDGEFDMGEIMERARKHMENANGKSEVVREFNIVIRMDEVTEQEAQALSEKSGQEFVASSNLQVNDLRLAPNPSNGMFNVRFDLPERGDAEMKVIDVNGNVVYTETLNNFTGKYNRDFDISGKAKGVYFMQILQNGKAFSRKIITQ